ncbi:enoyl-CoA hydratase/isomerase family protein [Alsobacter sp. SYSU M60028]|uniref:Enoyl-CoA hydratase/isomerase family protein n=1 Tax=Alsobacter ponti TaxID=2962936 RepID=A0ABT1LEP3_9HYPH|nr:enoyl-CoA hydratase/isomerase family protein [Alsobacter ponti]MCP8939967.1 enoyl-CoA hydratase/isomerase family protein [Alsobacter ponti]
MAHTPAANLGAPLPPAVTLERRGAVGIVTLNRPDRINAIDDEVRRLLPESLRALEDDPAICVIVLHGGEARGFCVGADISEKRAVETAVATRRRVSKDAWIDAFDKISKPIIAAVHGFCLGGGLEIALACDIRMASPDAQFGLPETGLGLIPGAGGTQRLPRLVGLGRALDLLLTGDRIDTAEAYRIGLVTRVTADRANLLDEAIALAERIAARAPTATRFVKEAATASTEIGLQAGLALERSLFALLASTADKAEAARAFKEKRPPQFTGE